MAADTHARDEILYLLRGGNAHMSFDDAVAEYPMASIMYAISHGAYTA